MSNFKKEVFGEGGMLHRAFGAGYELRHEQVNMSIASAKAIMNREVLLAEGATGVGKSFAYMIPSVSPVTRQTFKGPVVISTSTKVLQDQIYGKDVPAILDATGQPLDVVLAKGRNNYISVRRLEAYLNQVETGEVSFESHDVATNGLPLLNALRASLEATQGEFANFGEDVPLEIRTAIESTDTDCHGEDCASFGSCPYQRAKQQRKHADILIVNHALLALHIAFGRVLPAECGTFIIDEAHKFYESVSTVFSTEITLRQVHRFIDMFQRKLRGFREHIKDSVGMAHLAELLNTFEKRSRRDKNRAVDFFETAQREIEDTAVYSSVCSRDAVRFGFAVETPELEGEVLEDVLQAYVEDCRRLAEIFGIVDASEDDSLEDVDVDDADELHVDVKNLSKSASEIHSRFVSILSREAPSKWCYWSEVSPIFSENRASVRESRTEGNGVAHRQRNEQHPRFSAKDIDTPYRLTLKCTPIDISEQIAPLFKSENAVILTSATLQVSNSFDRIRQQLGLSGDAVKKIVNEKVYRSPFPYKENVEIHLFNNVLLDRPYPNASEDKVETYYQQQARLVEYYVRLREGRALILCSSNRLLHELYTRLEMTFEEMDVEVFRQMGTDRLKETVEAFKANETSVLFGVASCWEGLDAPGATLETVIIPQLPFAPPHPLIDARRALLDDSENWFNEISLPDMLLHLKQGAGRLVRSNTDTGVIAILSPRPLTKRYGRDIIKALPPGRLVRNCRGALDFLNF